MATERRNIIRNGGSPPKNWSTPMLKGRLIELIREMNVRPVRKNWKLTDLCDWVLHELPTIAPDDPRTAEAIAIADEWWTRDRT